MKRKTLKLFAGMLGMTVLLSITACSSSDETGKAAVTSIAENAAVETKAETKTGTESTENESQDMAETQTETGAQDKSEAQAETEPQDKSEAQAETAPQDKSEAQAETAPQDKAGTQTENETLDKAEAQSKTETKTEPEKGTDNNSEQYETLEDYFNDPEVRNDFDKQIAASSDEFTMSYDAKGTELVLTVKFTDNSIIGTNAEYIKAALASDLEAQADTFKEQAKELDKIIGKERACTIIVRYTDLNDSVFAEMAFMAD